MTDPLDDDLPALELDEEQALIQKGQRLAGHYLLDAAGLLATAKLEPDWLVPGAIPAGGVTFLVGKPGAAKSWLAYDLVVAVVQQRPWLRFGVPRSVGSPTAMVLNFDNPGSECARRFLRLGLRPGDHALFHSLGAHRPPEPLPQILQLPNAFEPLEAMIAAFQPDLIVIDSLRQAHTGDESSSQEMAQVMSQCRRMTLGGAAVIVVHHTRKNDGAMRGSTEIEAAADAIVDVDERVARWRKTRGWEMEEAATPFKLADEGDATILSAGETLGDLLARSGPLGYKQIASALGLSEAVASAMIAAACEAGRVCVVLGPNRERMYTLAKAS